MGAAMSMTWITEGARMRFEWCDAGHFEPRARFSACDAMVLVVERYAQPRHRGPRPLRVPPDMAGQQVTTIADRC